MHARRLQFAIALIVAGWTLTQPIVAATDSIRFNRDIRPILSDHCFQCHGPDARQRKADLRLDQYASATAKRDGTPAIVPNAPNRSALIQRITHADPGERMPPQETGRTLSPQQIDRLRRWIDEGAVYESHWAFIRPRKAPLPTIQNPQRARNPIDYFILARLEAEGLQPSPLADRETLIRRATLDLTGLPPTVPAIDAFVKHRSTQAYATVVKRLLASSAYGEHMAVAWLDAARYADSNGYNNDTPRFNWRWRDWVIEAFNQNLPYDRFIADQLAGDLFPNPSLEQHIATGFNRNHNITSEGGIIDEEYRLEYVADRVHTTATVFMALSLQCARCHDHKFDPITQKEYYQFFAFFNQVPETGYHKEHVGNVKPVLNAPTAGQSRRIQELEQSIQRAAQPRRDREQHLQQHLPDWTSFLPQSDRDHTSRQAFGDYYRTRFDTAWRTLSGQIKAAEQQLASLRKSVPTAMVMRDMDQARDTFILVRGQYDKHGDTVLPATPTVMPAAPDHTPSNRLGLAQWLVQPDHPLTARVLVNKLWHQLFGRGLVETLEDFGSQGAWPTHPELLDWLAVEFIESGWDIKHMLELMVTSATYQQQSRLSPEHRERDPANVLLARGPRFRLTAEMIRDQALVLGGLMHHQLGGPSVKPYQPPGLWVEVSVADDSYSGGPYKQDKGDALYRRSVYTWWKRTCPPPSLNTFDAPEREFCTVRRIRTNTPLQALVLLNDPTFVEAARGFAERLLRQNGEPDRIRLAFRMATGRLPTAAEVEVVRSALKKQTARFANDVVAAEKLIAVGDSVPDKNLDPVELAAWTTVGSMILNLDEVITKP